MTFAVWPRALPLFGFSFVEMAVSFVRMMILTHILGPYEFGFAAAISAAYAMVEQSTDMAIYRFVFSTPRSEYQEAMAGAHSLAILRGLFVAGCVLIACYPVACALANCGDWPSFAWLAPVAIIKSFEHLEIRVRERDYRYWPQFTASVVSHGCGLIALTWIAYQTGSHYAFIAYLVVQATMYVVASHILATGSYTAKLQTTYLQKAFTFGLPLLLNGIGLAIIAQGDRLMVGALMGLPALGFYTVLILAGIVPISGLFKIIGPLLFAGLQNAPAGSALYFDRLRLFCRALPLIAGSYALALIAFFPTIVPFIFGSRYAVPNSVSLFIALIAFCRLARSEPHTSLLLQTQNTSKLAVGNLSPAIGLLSATVLVILHPSIMSVLGGVLIGESVGLIAMSSLTRRLLKMASVDYLVSLLLAGAIVLTASAAIIATDSGDALISRATIAFGFFLLIAVGAGAFLLEPLRKAYGARES